MTSRHRLATWVTVIAAGGVACGGAPTTAPPPGGEPAASPATAEEPSELTRVLDRLMATPAVRADEGFTADVLIPPGELYDPLFMRDHDGTTWINDDGGEEGEKGSRILSIGDDGQLSVVIALGRLLPVTSFDIAPVSFAPYTGQVFSLAQAEVSYTGVDKNHIVQRIDPATGEDAEVFCTVPTTGTEGGGIGGLGLEARFGPEGSPFAGRFFSITGMNNTVYQTTPDGACTPFVIFDQDEWGSPFGVAFSPDGDHMLVSTYNGRQGSIAHVQPDGAIDTDPIMRSDEVVMPTGMAFAPEGFGDYGGELFFAALGSGGMQMTHAPAADGSVYRLTAEGEVRRVATGLLNPVGVHFAGDALWVSDISGDFIAGRRELPEGFVIEIRPAS